MIKNFLTTSSARSALALPSFNNEKIDAAASALLGGLLKIFFFTLLFWVLNLAGKALIQRTFKSYKRHAKLNGARFDTMRTLASTFFSYMVLFFYFYSILSVLGVPVGSLIAGAGVVGLAIGLGAQGFVSDVVTGFFIILEGQFDVGDSVTLGNISGTVTSVGIRTTIVQNTNGTVNYIPNRNISIVSNLSRSNMQSLVSLPMKADADLKKVTKVIEEVNEKLVPQVPSIKDGPEILGLSETENHALVFQVRMFVENGQQLKVQRKFLAAYVEALKAAGIDLATPSLTLSK